MFTGGRLNYTIALDITKYLAHEKDYVPWKAAMNALNFLDAMFIKGGEYHKLKVNNHTDSSDFDIEFQWFPVPALLVAFDRPRVQRCQFQRSSRHRNVDWLLANGYIDDSLPLGSQGMRPKQSA